MKYSNIAQRRGSSYPFFALWVYSSDHKLEIKKGRSHSTLNDDETPWLGCSDRELARGKFDLDMIRGSIAFGTDNICIQKHIADELRSKFKESIFYVFSAPNETGGEGVLLGNFMGEF